MLCCITVLTGLSTAKYRPRKTRARLFATHHLPFLSSIMHSVVDYVYDFGILYISRDLTLDIFSSSLCNPECDNLKLLDYILSRYISFQIRTTGNLIDNLYFYVDV